MDGLEELLRGYVEGNSGVYSERFSSPADFAQQLQMIPRMGGAYAEKVWMYLRWMAPSSILASGMTFRRYP